MSIESTSWYCNIVFTSAWFWLFLYNLQYFLTPRTPCCVWLLQQNSLVLPFVRVKLHAGIIWQVLVIIWQLKMMWQLWWGGMMMWQLIMMWQDMPWNYLWRIYFWQDYQLRGSFLKCKQWLYEVTIYHWQMNQSIMGDQVLYWV